MPSASSSLLEIMKLNKYEATIYNDSQLVVGNVLNKYEAREEIIKKYL